jgi:alpha-tubulin suppressor-like RCC1 family protein
MTLKHSKLLYALGSNGNGQLGIGSEEDTNEPTLCHFHSHDTEQDPIETLSCGGNHTLIISQSGRLLMSGLNSEGQCGVPVDRHQNFKVFHPHPSLQQCKLVACGWAHSIIVTTAEDGEEAVWSFGSNSHGQLGISPDLKFSSTPMRLSFVEKRDKIKTVKCGMRHTGLVTINGDLYLWGQGRHGQCADGDKTSKIYTPKRIPLGENLLVDDLSCGSQHSVIITKSGEILVAGYNQHGQLGIGVDSKGTSTFTLLHFILPPLVYPRKVDCGWHHTVAHLSDSSVLIWGRNNHHQLGFENAPEHITTNPLLHSFTVVPGSEHTITLREKDSTVLCFGWNEHGNCGPMEDQNAPLRLSKPLQVSLDAQRVFAGCATSFILGYKLS